MYEQCRFGRHIPFSRDILRDGLLRIPTRYPATNPGECDNFLNQVERHIGDNKSLIARLKVHIITILFDCYEKQNFIKLFVPPMHKVCIGVTSFSGTLKNKAWAFSVD